MRRIISPKFLSQSSFSSDTLRLFIEPVFGPETRRRIANESIGHDSLSGLRNAASRCGPAWRPRGRTHQGSGRHSSIVDPGQWLCRHMTCRRSRRPRPVLPVGRLVAGHHLRLEIHDLRKATEWRRSLVSIRTYFIRLPRSLVHPTALWLAVRLAGLSRGRLCGLESRRTGGASSTRCVCRRGRGHLVLISVHHSLWRRFQCGAVLRWRNGRRSDKLEMVKEST